MSGATSRPGFSAATDSVVLADDAPMELLAALLPDEIELYRQAEPYLGRRHNDVHSLVAAQLALGLMDQEGGDRSVVVPAILLHDIGWHAIPEELVFTAYGPRSTDAELNRRHETEGARMAQEILERLEYPPDRVQEIVRIIATHDSDPRALTLEEAVVKDADKVWRVTALGFRLHSGDMADVSDQELYEFIAVRMPRWLLTGTGLQTARLLLEELREEYGFTPAPDIPPPAGDGIGDMAPESEGAS